MLEPTYRTTVVKYCMQINIIINIFGNTIRNYFLKTGPQWMNKKRHQPINTYNAK